MTTLAVLEESTRYVNYTKEKHGGRIKFCLPQHLNPEVVEELNNKESDVDILHIRSMEAHWITYCSILNEAYQVAIEKYKARAQEARGLLPLDTATKVYYTASVKWWKHFCKLRSSKNAHPDIQFISKEIEKYL